MQRAVFAAKNAQNCINLLAQGFVRKPGDQNSLGKKRYPLANILHIVLQFF
jgi:hypothetical protein